MLTAPLPCPLCDAAHTAHLMDVGGQTYWRCETCGLTFLDASSLPTPEQERAVYALHQNDVHDQGYRKFLSKLAHPLLQRLPRASQGLDFGCGPASALAVMLREQGHNVALYDPIFAPDETALTQSYDFITCTETAEHFHHPGREFERLEALLRPGGHLAVMTTFQTDDSRFADWHYRRDPPNVVF